MKCCESEGALTYVRVDQYLPISGLDLPSGLMLAMAVAPIHFAADYYEP